MEILSKKQVGKKQLQIIYYVKNYINECKDQGINVARSSMCFFTGYTGSLGNAILKFKFFGNIYFFHFLKTLLGNIRNISTLPNYYVKKETSNKKNFYNLIISNASEKDFLRDGSYFDNYFQTNSRSLPNTLWFLNCVDSFIPKKIDQNVVLFTTKKSIIKYNLFYLIISFIVTLFKVKFSPKKMIHEFSFGTKFSNIISRNLLFEVSNYNLKRVLISYEAQPFQNNIFNKIKEINNKIKTIGFYHTSLTPLPVSMIKRSGSPDELMISGKFQKTILKKYLKWPSSSIKIVPSFRYIKKNLINMSGFIFLPYDFTSSKKIVVEFENFLKKSSKKSIGKLFKIKNHPHAIQSKKHNILIKELSNLIRKYKNRFSKNNKNNSIFIGSTTSVIIALEKGTKVTHICENPVFECYNDRMWKTLKVEQIGDNTFSYKLKKKKNLIQFSQRKNLLKKYCLLN